MAKLPQSSADMTEDKSTTSQENVNDAKLNVRLRQNMSSHELAVKDLTNTSMTTENNTNNGQTPSVKNSNAADALQRAMVSLYEASPDSDDNNEEIRKLDSQLDHLNEYMDKVEKRLKNHSEKLMETIKQQKEEREKRRRSFHERLDTNRQEDDDFQRQLTQILHRVDSLKRQSIQDISELQTFYNDKSEVKNVTE